MRLWDPASARFLTTLVDHTDPVLALALHPEARTLAPAILARAQANLSAVPLGADQQVDQEAEQAIMSVIALSAVVVPMVTIAMAVAAVVRGRGLGRRAGDRRGHRCDGGHTPDHGRGDRHRRQERRQRKARTSTPMPSLCHRKPPRSVNTGIRCGS